MPGRDGDNRKWPMKLRTTSGRVSKRSKTKGQKYLPGRTKAKPGDPGCEADALSAPWSIEKILKKPMKLRNMSEHVSKCLKRRIRRYSPGRAQVKLGNPSSEADASRVSGRAEETREKPTKLHNTSVQVRERSKERTQQNSPSRPGEEPEEPDDEAVIPGDPQNNPEPPRSVSDERVNRTNAPCRRNGPGGHLGEPEASRGVEGVQDRGMVVDDAKHDGMCPSSHGNECEVETNTPCREVEPEHHIGEPKASRAIGATKAMEMASDTMGDEMVRMAQQAAHAATQNKSKRDR